MTVSNLFNRWMAYLVMPAAIACFSVSALSQTKIKLGYMPIAEETPKFVASEKGFFRGHGLDVELVRFENGPDMGTALLGGSIQVGMIGTPGLINAAVAGRPLVAFVDNGSNATGTTGFEYYAGIAALEGSQIMNIGDLKGKRLAINVLKANSEAQTVMQVNRWNKENPGRAIDITKDIQLVVLPFGSMPAALQKGIVDAASMIEPFMTQLSMSNKVRLIAPVKYALPNWPVSFGIVRRDFGEKNVDVLRKFRAAWLESVHWIRKNPAEAKSIMQKFVGVSPEVAKRITLPDWSDDIRTTLATTELVMEGMLAAGMISKRPNLREFIVEDLSTLAK